jgi:ADP-ribosyl-[dinitrogen reductase] hydrolase
MERIERYRGSLLGLAAGDALGTTVEFALPGTFEPLFTIVGGGPFDLQMGQWTDDTSMALCLAESLVEKGGFDAVDQMNRYCRWWKNGHLSSTGSCFDIGTTTRVALRKFLDQTYDTSGRPLTGFCGINDPNAAGNGSLMRLAPVPLYFASSPADAVRWAGESSRTTHAALECVDACRYYAALIVGALQGKTKEELLSERFEPVEGLWSKKPLSPKVEAIASGSFKRKRPPEIRGTGYVVDCLEASLWAFHHGKDFRAGALLAANLGDDADTTGAVYGQLAGAFYGENDIPTDWRNYLALREVIESFAEKLLNH